MPKMRTNRAAAKRFRQTASGHLKRNKGFGAHIKTKKGPKRVRNLRKATLVADVDMKRIKLMLPYGR